jgi:hypothetical protein
LERFVGDLSFVMPRSQVSQAVRWQRDEHSLLIQKIYFVQEKGSQNKIAEGYCYAMHVIDMIV